MFINMKKEHGLRLKADNRSGNGPGPGIEPGNGPGHGTKEGDGWWPRHNLCWNKYFFG